MHQRILRHPPVPEKTLALLKTCIYPALPHYYSRKAKTLLTPVGFQARCGSAGYTWSVSGNIQRDVGSYKSHRLVLAHVLVRDLTWGAQYQCHSVPSYRHVRSFDPCFYIASVCCEFMPLIVDRGLSRVLRPRTQITCLINAIGNSSCAISDQACVCYDEDLNVQATACIMESCTVRVALSTKNLTATSCGISPNIGASYVPLFMAMTALCAVSILLRVVARLKAGYPVWWDDFIIGVSFVGSTLRP